MSRRINILIGLAVAVGLQIAGNGCAMLTTERVATFVATEVGKKAVKDLKEDHDQKKQEEAQQGQPGSQPPPSR